MKIAEPRENVLELKKQYEKQGTKNIVFILSAFLLLIAAVLISLQLGIAEVSLGDTAKALFKLIFVRGDQNISVEQKIVLLLRLPRVVLAVLAGAALSVSGVVMQGVTRNPLVSPFTIGISSAAAFGASIAIVFNFVLFPGSVGGIVLNAFLFSLLCASLVYGISWKYRIAPETLILTGIALNYLFAALTSVVQFVAEEHQLAEAVQWAFGSLNGASWNQNFFLSIVLLVSLPVLFRYSLAFNALSTGGDELTQTLGINPTLVKAVTGIIAVVLTAATISFTGIIGFVGLVGPHIARLLIGGDHRYLIPFSLVIGSILVIVADTIGRTILSPVIIPVGIVISFIGVPLFVNLIIARKTRYYG
jgi:iron complex transport system permease protein